MLPVHQGEEPKVRGGSEWARRADLLHRQFRSMSWRLKFALVVGMMICTATFSYAWRVAAEASQLNRGLREFQALGLRKDVIPILIPVYSRPHYLQRVIESLSRARGINDTVLVFSQDGRNEDIAALIDGIRFARTIHLWHSPPYWGLPSLILRTDAPTAANVFYLLRFAFDFLQIPAAIVLESDIELSVDGFEYFRWSYQQLEQARGGGDADDTAAADGANGAERPAGRERPQRVKPAGQRGRGGDAVALRDKVFTINGFYEGSRPDGDPYAFHTDKYGFMVWGWLCPHWSWPAIKSGFTWFGNWDITMENSIRRPSGTLSLSPYVSRTRNIGMQGINFNIQDAAEVAKWEQLYIPQKSVPYNGKKLVWKTKDAAAGA